MRRESGSDLWCGGDPYGKQSEQVTDLFGTPDAPMIGGVIWNGSLHLTPPPGLSEVAELRWRLDYDLVWTMRHLIKIVDKDTNERIDFELNEPQSWAMWQLMDMLATGMPIRLWLLKGRQFGFSTLLSRTWRRLVSRSSTRRRWRRMSCRS